MADLLHPEYFSQLRFAGKDIGRRLGQRIVDIKEQTRNLSDPDISVVIRTRNDMEYLPTLFTDIKAQKFIGKVEVILVDTESHDGTVEFAKAQGARVVPIKQRDFTYPRALNLGFQAAKYPYVVTLVGHSSLVTPYMFKAVSYWGQRTDFGGMFGTAFADWNASRTEKVFWIFGGGRWTHAAKELHKYKDGRLGLMAANASVVKKSVWQTLGYYNERYAGGGEDGALGRAMLNNGYLVVQEPLASVYHSHHLGPVNMIRQIIHWHQIVRPTVFDGARIADRRPDLRT